MLAVFERIRQRVINGDWRNHLVIKPEGYDAPGPGCLLQLLAQEGEITAGGILYADYAINSTLIEWNDDPSRTAQDVIDLLDRCIARQINGQD